MEYLSFDKYMKKRFGGKVYRLSLSTGCTCPHRNGTSGGCIFCSAGGSGEFASAPAPIDEQIETAKQRVAAKLSHSFAGYMAYFQSFTNTYFRDDNEFEGTVRMFFAAARHPEIVALAIATRPDCLPDRVMDMLKELNEIKPVIVELGLQTVSDETARLINRGYPTAVYDDAVLRLHKAGLGVVTHVIIGLPGEAQEAAEAAVRHIITLHNTDPAACSMPDGIKLQLLHVLKGTELAEMLAEKRIEIKEYSLTEYSLLIKHLLSIIPDDMIVHRLTGDPPKSLLISPLWTADKKRVLNTLKAVIGQ